MYNFPTEPKIPLSSLIFRTLAGVIGGGFGSVIILLGVLLSSSLVQSIVGETGESTVHPLFIFFVIALAFIALLVADLITVTFLTYLNREKFTRLFSSLVQVFIMNIVIAVFTFPLYLMVSAQNVQNIAFIVGLQVILSVTCSVLTMETLAKSKHLILSLYAIIIAIVTTVIFSLAMGVNVQTSSQMAFLIMPLTWGLFAFWHCSGEMVYQWTYGIYGEDFLSSETSYGEDYGRKEEEEGGKEIES
jgi:hypothetical protein